MSKFTDIPQGGGGGGGRRETNLAKVIGAIRDYAKLLMSGRIIRRICLRMLIANVCLCVCVFVDAGYMNEHEVLFKVRSTCLTKMWKK
jgi:hypothetical protein